MGKGDIKGSPGKGGGMGQGGQRMKVTVVDMGATKILDEVELNANDFALPSSASMHILSGPH